VKNVVFRKLLWWASQLVLFKFVMYFSESSPAICELQYSVLRHYSRALCDVDHTLHAGLDDLLRVAQAYYVDDPDKLVRAAAQGNLDVVREVVRKHPSKVCGFELIYTCDNVDIMQ